MIRIKNCFCFSDFFERFWIAINCDRFVEKWFLKFLCLNKNARVFGSWKSEFDEIEKGIIKAEEFEIWLG